MITGAIKKLAGGRDRVPLAAFISDEATRRAIAEAAEDLRIRDIVLTDGGVASAPEQLAQIPTPQLVIVDLQGSTGPLDDMDRLAGVCDPGTRVIALGGVNDVDLFRALLTMGVQDYLIKPVNDEALRAAIGKAFAEPEDSAPADNGPKLGGLLAVVGARGGVGATMVAVNTAWLMAERHNKRVALVDLDLYFGTTSLALDLEPGRGFREALENPSRIDALFIERAMVQHSDRLFVLSAEEGLGNAFGFDPAALNLLLENLRHDFDWVVLDLPRFAVRTNLATMSLPFSTLIVSDPSLAGMRDSARLAHFIREKAPEAGLTVALNRVGETKTGQLSKDDFQKGAEVPHLVELPFDLKPSVEAAGTGKPLAEVGRKSKLTDALDALAVDLLGDDDAGAGQPFWRRLLKRRAA